MADTCIEESERIDAARGLVTVRTMRRPDGSEYQDELFYTCSICGAKGDRPFPRSAISCFRSECLDQS